MNDLEKFLEQKRLFLIHSVNPQSRSVGIIVFAHVFLRPSVHTFQNLAKQNKAKTMFATGETVGLAEWIIDDTCLVNIVNTYFRCEIIITHDPGPTECIVHSLLFIVLAVLLNKASRIF